jgi:hypothetical protein
MISAIIYNLADGRIEKQIQCLSTDVVLNIVEGQGWLPYTGAILNKKVANNSVVDMTAEEIIAEQGPIAWLIVRQKRNALLQKSDWLLLSDVPLSLERKQEWVIYRQQLRDITNQSDPFNIVWPIPPQ